MEEGRKEDLRDFSAPYLSRTEEINLVMLRLLSAPRSQVTQKSSTGRDPRGGRAKCLVAETPVDDRRGGQT